MHDFLTFLGPILVAATGLMALCGGGVRFVWKKVEIRFEEIEGKLEECQKRDLHKDKQLQAMGLALRLLVPEVQRLDPHNTTLSQVRSILQQHFPIELAIPDDMCGLLAKIL